MTTDNGQQTTDYKGPLTTGQLGLRTTTKTIDNGPRTTGPLNLATDHKTTAPPDLLVDLILDGFDQSM
jgi:hypothetical protein